MSSVNDLTLLQRLPSTDRLLTTETAAAIRREAGNARLARLARAAVQTLREELRKRSHENGSGRGPSKSALLAESCRLLEAAWAAERGSRLRKVINATGVIVHTNLGRSPLSKGAIEAINAEASGYCTLEYDLKTGKRGRRGLYAERLAAEISGAESAVVVNNCAAAAFLVLTVFAQGKEVIVSRGELVEIGGDFRIPDVLAESGAQLREVGTTNRTRILDYEKAVNETTALILRVHPSNYRIIGFTATPTIDELATTARQNNLILYEDAGSGALMDLASIGLADEPVVSRSIEQGADIVTFSGDKLLGGPQCGIIAGRRELIDRIKTHPLYRALRVDKLTYAALGATLESYACEKAEEIPVQRMLRLRSDALAERTKRFVAALKEATGPANGLSVTVVAGLSVVGGGAAPNANPQTTLAAITHQSFSTAEIEQQLRFSDPPIIARIEEDSVLIDLRTVSAAEEGEVLTALIAIANFVGN